MRRSYVAWRKTRRYLRIPAGNAAAPAVTSIDKDVGDYSGGTAVTITGSNFTGATGATIGGVALTSFNVVNDTTITGTTGSHAIGIVDVVVTGPGGPGTLENAFEYFNPTSIANCILWLRADLGVTTSGGEVTAWADQSGSGDTGRNATPPGTDKPAYNATDASYNNKATIGTFNKAGAAADCRLRTGTWNATYTGDGTTAFTLAFVGHGSSAGNRYFTHEQETDYISIISNVNTPRVYAGNSGSTIAAGSPGGFSTAPAFGMAEYNGASSKLFVNATETAAATGTLVSSTLGNAGLNLGSYPGDAQTFGIEKAAEYFAYSRVLTSSEKIRLRKYLNDRYATSMTN